MRKFFIMSLLYFLFYNCATTEVQKVPQIELPPSLYDFTSFKEKFKIKLISIIGDSSIITSYYLNPYQLYESKLIILLKDEEFKEITKRFFKTRGLSLIEENHDILIYLKLDILTVIHVGNFKGLMAIKVKIFDKDDNLIFDKIYYSKKEINKLDKKGLLFMRYSLFKSFFREFEHDLFRLMNSLI